MASYLQTHETGIAVGTDVTLANSDDGTAGFAWTPVKTAGGTVKFAAGLVGARAIAFAAAASGDVARADITGLVDSKRVVTDYVFSSSGYPSADTDIIHVRTAAGQLLAVRVSSTGKLKVANAQNATINGVNGSATSTPSVPSSGSWRIGVITVIGTTTSNSVVQIWLYTSITDDTGTLLWDLSNVDMGTVNATVLRLGKITSAPTWASLTSDHWQISDTRTTRFDPPNVDEVTASADQTGKLPGETVTVSATGSGTVTWSQVSGPTVTLTGAGGSRTFVAPARFTAQTVVLRATVGTATDDISIGILPTGVGLKVGGTVVPAVTHVKG